MPGAIQVRLLGQFSLTVDGRPAVGPTTARLQSLFAYLLLHGDAPQPRAHLSFTFWPDASESNARNNLRQLLHQLRQALPDPDRYLRADANSVQWVPDPSFSLDVALLERAVSEAEAAARAGDAAQRRACLERAVDLCQGPLLPSCYDDWIGPLRERLARRCEDAVAVLVGLLEEQREYPSAIARVRHWLQHDPLDEEAYRWLIRLLALAGDRVAALQAYRQCADVLRRELATEPSAATVRTFERIRDAAQPGLSGPSAGREASPAALPLVGRQAEWSRLREAWERAVVGRTSFALVTGDAGIGKSRLAEELLIWAERQGVSTAKTRSYAAEGRLSLAPVSDWLRSDALSPHFARLEDVWRVEVARILPELLAARPDLPRPAPMTEFGDRLRFFEGLARAVLAAPQPLLLLIDDLQWCDRETIEWLHFLSRFDPGARLLVLGTARSEELDAAHPLPALLRHLRGASQLVEIALEPFDAAETAALAAQVGNRALGVDAATRLYHETEGNPLFVVETVRAGSGGETPAGVPEQEIPGLPPRAHAVIAGRLAQLSDHARETVAAAATIGRAFDLEVLVSLVGDEEMVARALDELWRKRIVREQGPNVYDFTHDKLRDVAYGETSAPQRRRLHRRVAEALVASHENDLDPVSAQIAAHYESAGLLEQAIPHYSRAAVVARGVYAHDEAIALVGRGLSLLRTLPASARRDAWELELQLVLAPSYRVTLGWAAPELGAVLERALALCDRVGTSAQRAQVLYGMQSSYIVAGRLEKSALITDEMVRVFRETQGSEPPRSAFAMLAGVRLQMGRFQEACDDVDDLVREADPSQLQHLQESQGLNYEVLARAWQSHALWCLGRPDTAFERATHAQRLARELEQPFSQAIAATYLALLQQLRADPATFRRQAEEALGLATEFKATYYRAFAAIFVAYAETLGGPSATELSRLRDAIQSFKETGARLRLPYYLALLGEAHLRRGEADAGLEVVEEALSCSRETNERWWDAELHRLRGALLLASGAEAAEAEAALRRALEIARGQRAKSLELRAAQALADLWARSGRTAEARNLLAPVYSSFTEGLETPDLQAALALLSSLG
jgi:DNA-binding SARP family transcriptional activator/predicted negative regulator of RcsB-dependent stress response